MTDSISVNATDLIERGPLFESSDAAVDEARAALIDGMHAVTERVRIGSPVERTYHMLWWKSGVRESYAVVASVNAGQWAAYMGLAPSQSDTDLLDVAKRGAKLSEEEARAFARARFGLADLPYRA